MRLLPRFAALLVLPAALLSCTMFDYSNIVVHKYAFVYGVTTYSMSGTPGNPNLSYPDQDASTVAAFLTSQGYTVYSRWVDQSGFVWVDGSNTGTKIGSPNYDASGVFTDSGAGSASAPTQAVIIGDLTSHAGSIGPNDVVLVYFSGHGTQDTSVSPPREYFVPYQGVAYFADAQPADFYADVGKCVRDDQLASAFSQFSTQRKVLVLDTCNSGGFIGNQLEADWTAPGSYGPTWVDPGTLAAAIAAYASMQASPTGLSPYGAQVISAAGRDQLSYETSSYGHGVMTYWLLQGLSGPADLNKDGHITVLEAFSYAKAGIDQNWNATNPVATDGTPASFEPHVSGGPVDFVLF